MKSHLNCTAATTVSGEELSLHPGSGNSCPTTNESYNELGGQVWGNIDRGLGPTNKTGFEDCQDSQALAFFDWVGICD